MDPLSITVAIIALLGTARKTIKTVNAFRAVPEQLDSLLNDLTDAELLIKTVESSLEASKDQELPAYLRDQVNEKLEGAKLQLLDILELLRKFGTRSGRPLPDFKNAAHWVVAKGKVERLKERLESVCESLRASLNDFKFGCIELKVENVSVALVEASVERKTLHNGLTESIATILQNQQTQQNSSALLMKKLSSIENYMHTDQLPALMMAESPPQYKASQESHRNYERVAVYASRRRTMCDIETCICECHRDRGQHNQQTLRTVLGSIFAGRKESLAADSQVTYYFPRWWVANRMLGLVANMVSTHAGSNLPPPPRIVPPYARVFRHAMLGQSDVLRDMFASGLGSPTDTDSETGVTPFFYACTFLREGSIKYLLNRGADRNAKSFDGFTAIQESWSRLLTNTVPAEKRYILEDICEDEDLDSFEFSDLHRAVLGLVHTDVPHALRNLVTSADATINDLDIHGRSAVSWAAQKGDFDTLNTLLEWGAEPDAPRGRKSPIIWAAGQSRSTACVTCLIKHRADVHAADTAGLNALMWACVNYSRHFAHVQPLIEVSDLERHDINERTAIFHAASTHISPTETLIRAGANIDHRDRNGLTALHMAISHHHTDIFQALMRAKANYVSITSSGQNLLHYAALYADIPTLNVMTLCGLRDLDTQALDHEGCTPYDRLKLRIPQPSNDLVAEFERLLIYIRRLQATTLTRIHNELVSPTSTVASSEWHSAAEDDAGAESDALQLSLEGSDSEEDAFGFDAEYNEERRDTIVAITAD